MRILYATALIMGSIFQANASDLVFGTLATPSKNPVSIGEQVSLTYSGTVEGATTVEWFVADGAVTLLGNPVAHTFEKAGGHFVTLRILNARGELIGFDIFNIVVIDPTTDSDGDGVLDSIENVLRTNPLDKVSTPAPPLNTRFPKCLPSKFSIRADETKASKDNLMVVVRCDVHGDPAGSTLLVDVGGVLKSFTVSREGKQWVGRGDSDSDKLTIAGNTIDGVLFGTFSIVLKSGTFAATLSRSGLFSSAPFLPVNLVIRNELFSTRFNFLAVKSKGRSFSVRGKGSSNAFPDRK